MTKSDKVLVILFRYLLGIGSLFALVPVVMPWSWMAATHRWLGLGEMPTGPIVEYLARSLSAFYALVGALCLVMASDLDRTPSPGKVRSEEHTSELQSHLNLVCRLL